MVQKTVISLIDDISGDEADETVSFALDGKAYEIDLSDPNAEEFRKVLEPYLAAGRRTGGRASAGTRSRGVSSKGSGQDMTVIRAWARNNGHKVNARGRIPASIREAYEKANG
ncbi:Lsr2 family protein [Streptomyces sp. NPDC020707]|uniref:Lsr2 family protein n=1 Tax=Streptomyces sp. NPDC020707 TaxID=3365084 RepID=UPI00378796B4